MSSIHDFSAVSIDGKSLVDKSGKVVKRYAPGAAPNKISSDIEPLLV